MGKRLSIVHNGQQFRTADGVYYQRIDAGSDTIRRTVPKVRGKAAKRRERMTRCKSRD